MVMIVPASGVMIWASRRDGDDAVTHRVVTTALAVVMFRGQTETSTVILAGRRVVHRHQRDGPFCCCAYILVVAMSMRIGDGSPKAIAIGDGRDARLVGRQWRRNATMTTRIILRSVSTVVSTAIAAEEGYIAYEAAIFGLYLYASLIVIGIAVIIGVS